MSGVEKIFDSILGVVGFAGDVVGATMSGKAGRIAGLGMRLIAAAAVRAKALAADTDISDADLDALEAEVNTAKAKADAAHAAKFGTPPA